VFSMNSAMTAILQLLKCKYDNKLIPQLFDTLEPFILLIIQD